MLLDSSVHRVFRLRAGRWENCYQNRGRNFSPFRRADTSSWNSLPQHHW